MKKVPPHVGRRFFSGLGARDAGCKSNAGRYPRARVRLTEAGNQLPPD